MKHRLELTYNLGEGWMRPWLDGLTQGVAMASTCSACDAAYFPPVRICPSCRLPSDGWRQLPGNATIRFRTTGLDGDYVMAQFDGATGAAITRANDLPPDAKQVRITACPDDPPTLTLTAEPGS